MRKISGITFHLYHYAGNNPVKYIDPDGREDKKIDWFKEVTDCFGSLEVGLRNEVEFSIPNFISVNLYVDLMSVGMDEDNPRDTIYSQGVGCSVAVSVGQLSIIDLSVEYSREGRLSEEYNCPLALIGEEFELKTDGNKSPNYDLTLPIQGVSVSIDVFEVYDLVYKILNSEKG